MDFVQTMKDWRRMCDTIQSKNQKTSTGGWCKGCSLQGLCIIDTSIKDSTNGEFNIIGEQIQAWAAEHPEPVYPTWLEWLHTTSAVYGTSDIPVGDGTKFMVAIKNDPIPADLAQKLGLQPKEG